MDAGIREDYFVGGLEPDRKTVERVRARDDAGAGEDDALLVVQNPVRARAVADINAVHGDAERDEDGRAVHLFVNRSAVHFKVVYAVGKPEVDEAAFIGVDVGDAVAVESGNGDGP